MITETESRSTTAVSQRVRTARWSLALVGAGLGLHVFFYFFPRVADYIGLSTYLGWYLDLHALLAAGEAAQAGLGHVIYYFNPFDALGRPHSYSNWWLVMGPLGLKRADLMWLGLLCVLLFLVAVAVSVRPRNAREFGFGALLILSPAVQLGLERANNDLIVFIVLAPLALCLTSRLPVARLCSAFLVAFATGLKYYPLVAAPLLAAGRTRREIVWRGVLFLGLGTLVALSVYEDTLYFARSLPAPRGLLSFGAPAWLATIGWDGLPARLALAVALAAGLWLWRDRRAASGGERRESATETELLLVLGALVLAGCFWAGMNWGYRWIFALWLIPSLVRPAAHPWLLQETERKWLCVLVPACLWADGLVLLGLNVLATPSSIVWWADRAWWSLQAAHWTVAAMLTLICVRFGIAQLRAFWFHLR